jgi:8-oxo-dGTP pyrophosphatase MutT (NUDIX family)
MAGSLEGREAPEAPEVDVSAARSGNATVRAAGGIVVRQVTGGGWQVLLVHRPRYDDWSLPKGKADPGERDEETALREVEEETGLRCTLGIPAGRTRYRDSKGRDKVVHYWLMEPASEAETAGDAFVANDEVDEVRWCSVAEATDSLSYAHDRKLLAKAPVPS